MFEEFMNWLTAFFASILAFFKSLFGASDKKVQFEDVDKQGGESPEQPQAPHEE